LIALLVGLIYVLDRPWGDVPAIGPSLSPFHGLWQRSRSPFEAKNKANHYYLKGLRGRVEIQVDSDQIKHVFAENDDDLYFAQGWIVAADRLWEMEFLTRLAAGRLAEVFGVRALPLDRMFRRLGLPDAAKESATLMLQDPDTGPALRSYASGVNSYIQSLDLAKLPVEYRLLGQRPEPWTPDKAALLLKFMTFNLSGHSSDLKLSRSRAILTREDFDELFPLNIQAQNSEPIFPKGTRWPMRMAIPSPPKKEFLANLGALASLAHQPNPANGSNNWAVSGKKSTTGLPILSNDIHLDYHLPALWYEMQLISPRQNVYGISLPGAPGIILGFNAKVAWGVTNGGSDILDWYQLRYRDQKKNEYLYDGTWRPVISREIQVKIKNALPEHLLLRTTHFGPIVYEDSEAPLKAWIPKGLAMRWGGLDASNELKSFLLLNRARSVDECRIALETYQNPAQNFLCADNGGKIAMWHMGRLPLRWPGQGRMISDGSSTDFDWKGWVPRTDLPAVRNPERGFLSSANQAPTDDEYPFYLGWSFETPWRGIRINEMLREKKKLSPEEVAAMQSDTLAIPARSVLPVLLKSLQEGAALDEREKEAVVLLNSWNYHFTEDSIASTIFYSWFNTLQRRLWSSRFSSLDEFLYPRAWSTVRLLLQGDKTKWIDDPSTPVRETLRDLALASFRDALGEITEKMGTSSFEKWKWVKYHPTFFGHIAKIPGLGRGQTAVAGVDYSVLANQGNHGPVWKMVVAVGAKPRAWAIYPGGQSGDPMSPYYDNFIEAWRVGKLKEITYLTAVSDENPRFLKTVSLEGVK
jgi:penicillin amidase